MESLNQIESALEGEWGDNALLYLVETLVIFLSNPGVSKKEISSVWRISEKLKKMKSIETKSFLSKAFHLASGNFHLQLNLYNRLSLKNDLIILAKLAQKYQKTTSKPRSLPQFKVSFEGISFSPNDKHGSIVPGAVFVSRLSPTPESLEYFCTKFISEKVSKETRELLPLFKPMISQLTTQNFSDTMHGALKRLSIRSSSTLPIITDIYKLLECDISDLIPEIIFPTILEYLYQKETFASALELIKQLLKKSKNLYPFIKQLVTIRNANEAQTVSILQLISVIPSNNFSQDLLDFVISISQRIKSESFKSIIATSLYGIINNANAPVDFLLSNATNPYFANIIYKLGLKLNLNYNQTNPMALVSLISIQIPQPATAKITQFITESGSPLFGFQNLSSEEQLSVTRAIINSLGLYPANIHLIKKFSKSLVGKYSTVREYCLKNWPEVPISLLLPNIKETFNDEVCLNNFLNSFKKITRIITQKLKNPEDIDSFLFLVTSNDVISKKNLKYVLKNYTSLIEKYTFEVFSRPETGGLALCIDNYEGSVMDLLKDIEYENIMNNKKTLEYVQQVFDDPNFEEIGKFNQMCRDLLKSANMPTEIVDFPKVSKSLEILWQRSIDKAKLRLKIFSNALKYRKALKSLPKFFEFISFNVLSNILKLVLIPELQANCWDFISCLVLNSNNFYQISWHFTMALFNCSKNQWSEKSLNTVFKYIEHKITINRVENSEAFMLERILLWVLKQSGTSLRATALSILIDFLHSSKFSSLQETVEEICILIESYSSPLLNSLFQPLLDILEPHHWESFFNILLKLQPNTKQIILDSLLQYNKLLPCEQWLVTPVYLCLFDDTDVVSSSAAEVWEKNQLVLSLDILDQYILKYLFDENLELSLITAQGLKDALEKNPAWYPQILARVQASFITSKQRNGFAKFLEIICNNVAKPLVLKIEEFLLDVCMTCDEISKELLRIGILYLNTHGDVLLNELFTIIQIRTTNPNEKIRNSAVVLIGYLAKFFTPEDFRIESTIELLLKSLDMPSDLLFSTVSKFLPRLVSFRQQIVESLLIQEFKKLFENKSINERRGAGYGIGCLVKGGGLKCLVSYNVLDKLEVIINNKKSNDIERAGVLIAIEGLGAVLGRSFEPYLGEVLPFIIDCFANKELQEQAAISTKVMISKLSAHGMRRILPQLTHGLEETKWRSKVGAIEALGKMAFCAPKQLSAALPSIVPQVIKAFSDTNPKVLEAANKAISDIGSVITNPEIFQLVNFLSKALGDISHLSEAFKVLIDTTFHHYLDTPSLSLIVPLIETGLRSRNSEYKKQACQIVGGITSLIRSPSEFSPYLERITAAMKFSLFDNLPEVRNIAAQNLASFCEGIGEEYSQSIISWIKETMEKSSLNFERSGAIHAYSEYLLYGDKWETMLDQLLEMTKNPSSVIKESYLGLFIFIPLNTQGKFEKYLEKVFVAFLDRLSDENEDVRKIVIRVTQLIIQTYCKNSLQIILPPLEKGLFDKNWRKRSSCITLIGEMVEKIESLSRKENQQLISNDHKNRILASVYILRADNASNISTQAAQIWKTHVDNTPKFLVTLTPELVLRLIEISDNSDQEPREIASFAIQSLIQKYQNKIFSSYLKHFLTHFEKYSKGVAFVLRTVCETASRNLLITYSEPIIQILEVLLKSDDIDYLHNAGGIFHDMYQKTTIEKPDPAVLALLDKMVNYPKACKELLGFKNIGINRSLLPKIVVASQRAVILPIISKIIADDLFTVKGLESLFPKLLKEYEEEGNDILLSIQTILSNILDPSSLMVALNAIQDILSSEKKLTVVNYFCKNTSILYFSFVDKLLEMTLCNLGSGSQVVLTLLPETVKLVLSPVDKEQLPDYFQIFKNYLNTFGEIPLFNIPKGLEPFLPLIQNSLMYGNVEIKELAARSYFEVIERTQAEILNAYAVMIVGPLIRVLSEKVPGDVKVSILDALYLLLQKSPLKLKPFISQLQSTFTKALAHQEENVRGSGARNILELLKMKPRLDLLFGDLGTLVGPSEVVVKSLQTLQEIVRAADVPSPLLLSTCNRIIIEISASTSKEVAVEAGKLIFLMNMDLTTVISSVPKIYPSIILVAQILSNSSSDALVIAREFIDASFKENYEDTMKLFEIVAKVHTDQMFDIFKYYSSDIARDIVPALGMLSTLSSDRFNTENQLLAVILPALAKECLEYNEDNQEILKNTIKSLFNVQEKGIKNILKVLHVLDEDTQSKFRNYAQKLVN